MAQLKPCPLCGKQVSWVSGKIECGCGLSFRFGSFELTNERWNQRAYEDSEEEIICVMCGESFTPDELKEMADMGEHYHQEESCFLCPDCWDDFRRMDPEEQAKMAILNGWKEAEHGTKHTD